ncbi:hypothetical protein GM3708_638 [Geminocystis sp. NIES-3708]|uniref:hypothetical protein n=1 Tax=Geminocystis sp. NIES-3708 TaxID=1615909 RepID=UPI0005FCC207|nr:hypothetical protein [Geminocystis sp. NIES-3708]BAQ60232.1 hypothetical protein GM3708_638 [Geminocystis sp. NIES-3708]
MSNHEDVKELLHKKKLKQVLLIALSNSLKLKLTTTSTAKNTTTNIETKINLLKGLTTKISADTLISNNNHGLNFHQKQVENAYETWEKNRETLVKLLQIIAGNNVKITSSIEEKSEELFPLAAPENYIEDTSFEDDFSNFESDSTLENSLNYQETQEYQEPEEEENWIDDLENETEESNKNIDEAESFDGISLDVEMMAEEEISVTENKVEEEENWDDFIDEIPEEETIIKEEVVISPVINEDSPSLEVDDDWQEWLEEDNSSNHNGEHDSPEIDWNQEDWQEEEEIS